jgi:hypothetical protein
MHYQLSCGYICKREKKSTRLVRLVLTGVRITNFFIYAIFDLIFLHNTHILSVCLSFFSVCPVCLSVCLYVCLMYSTVGMYRMCESSVCFSACTSTFAQSICLNVCLCTSVRLYFHLSVSIFEHLSFCTSVCLSTCISALLHSSLPSCSPAFLPAILPAFLPASPPACLPACMHE